MLCKWCSLAKLPFSQGVANLACQDSFLFGSFSTSVCFPCLGQSAAPHLAHLLFLSILREIPHRRRRRRSSIVGIDLQMMTNAPFFRMKTALAKPTTDRDRPETRVRSPSPLGG